jgi:hypothetical protein
VKRVLFSLVVACALPVAVAAAASQRDVVSQLGSIEVATQQIRGLYPRHAVKTELLTDARFASVLKAITARDKPDSEILLTQKELVLLGLLDRGAGLRQLIYQNDSNNLLAFFDPRSGILYVRNDSVAIPGPQRYLIAGEYTHALQDQYHSLRKLEPSQIGLSYRNSDAVEAHVSLADGDAYLTQTLFIERTYSSEDLRQLVSLPSGTKTSTLPPVLAGEFNFPYADHGGLGFARRLYNAGGMTEIDGAYRRPPRSTYEIMFPRAYLARWKPTSVNLHTITGLTAWKQIDDDVFGALGYDLLLEQWLPRSRATQIVMNYRGDRYVALESGTHDAMLFDSRWKSYPAARSARDALIRALKLRYPHAHVVRGNGILVVSPTQAVFIAVSHARMTMAYAPTATLARQIGTAPTS